MAARPATAETLTGPLPAQVMQVVDGDTLAVRVHVWLGQEITTRVRLTGIDTPELRGKCESERLKAAAARAELSHLLQQKNILLYDIRQDKYGGRVLARAVTIEGLDVGRHLITAGMARDYAGATRAGWCG